MMRSQCTRTTPLQKSLFLGNTSTWTKLIRSGYRIMRCFFNTMFWSQSGKTPLTLALSKWDFELVDILLEKGATDMPLTSIDINEVNSKGESRFVAAIRSYFYMVAAFLLKHGASKPAGLLTESIDGDPNMERFKWLIDHGFDANELDKVLGKILSDLLISS